MCVISIKIRKNRHISKMFIGYMPIISDNYPMKGLFQCPHRNVAAFFVSCMFVLLRLSNLKKLAIDVNFVNNGQLLFPNFISNRLCLGSAAIKISSKDTIT